MRLERRSSFGWPATAADYAPCNRGLVVHYDGSDRGLAGKPHSACRSYWKWCRRFHMDKSDPKHGWRDIGYSFAVCPHGIVMEGRGWQREQAAQPGGNTSWTSVTFMTGDGEKPTSEQLEAFRQLRAWLRGKGLQAGIKGHRDFVSTSCPGSVLYRMVKSGALAGAPNEEDDMPSVKDIWEWDGIPSPRNASTHAKNPTWKPASFLQENAERIRDLQVAVAANGAAINELAKTLAALAADRGQQVDPDALVQRITAAIESVTVHLDVADAEDGS